MSRTMTRKEARRIARLYVSDDELRADYPGFVYQLDDEHPVMHCEETYESPADILFLQVYEISRRNCLRFVPDSWDVSPEEWRLGHV